MKLPQHEEYIVDKTISEKNWSGASLTEVDFKNIQFRSCNFSQAILHDCHFDSCSFTDCNLEMIKVGGSNFSDVRFEKSRMRGILWDGAGLSFHDIRFSNSDLDYSSFYGRKLDNHVTFDGCSLQETSFESTSLKNGKITNCLLRDARFTDAELSRTDFSHSSRVTIDLGSHKVKKPIFTLPEALCLFEQFDIEIV